MPAPGTTLPRVRLFSLSARSALIIDGKPVVYSKEALAQFANEGLGEGARVFVHPSEPLEPVDLHLWVATIKHSIATDPVFRSACRFASIVTVAVDRTTDPAVITRIRAVQGIAMVPKSMTPHEEESVPDAHRVLGAPHPSEGRMVFVAWPTERTFWRNEDGTWTVLEALPLDLSGRAGEQVVDGAHTLALVSPRPKEPPNPDATIGAQWARIRSGAFVGGQALRDWAKVYNAFRSCDQPQWNAESVHDRRLAEAEARHLFDTGISSDPSRGKAKRRHAARQRGKFKRVRDDRIVRERRAQAFETARSASRLIYEGVTEPATAGVTEVVGAELSHFEPLEQVVDSEMKDRIALFAKEAASSPAAAACVEYMLGRAGLLPAQSQGACAARHSVTREQLRGQLATVRRIAARIFDVRQQESPPNGAPRSALEDRGHPRPRRQSSGRGPRGRSPGRSSRR